MEEVVRVLIFEEPITSILAGVILSIAFGGLQLLPCFKAKKAFVKKIPVFIVLAFTGIVLLGCTGIFGKGTGFLGNAHYIVAGICTIILGFVSLGIAGAWMLYKYLLKQRR